MALSKQSLTAFILVGVVAVVVLIKLLSAQFSKTIDPVAARSLGPANAKVNIVEFIDFECPACAHGAKLLKEYAVLYPGQIRLQVKYYPLMNIHRHALQVASYAECMARQGKFWPFFEPLAAQQAQWTQLVSAEGVFDQLAKGAGADMGKLKTCLSSEDVSTTIMGEKTLGRSLGVQSTPTYFINDKMVVGTKSLTDELNNYFPKTPKN